MRYRNTAITVSNNIKIELTLPPHEDILAGTISRLGYPGPEAVRADISDQIHQGIDRCRKAARVDATSRWTVFTGLTKTAICGENLCLKTVNWTRLAARMSGIRELCCFAVTLGGAIDDQVKQLGKRAILQAMMLDAAAAVLADLYADQIQQQLNRLYQQRELQSSARFSPGYCDWPMKEGQEALIPFLRPEAIGIQASSSGMMIPLKSITGTVIAAERMPAASPCFLCARNCPHRRASFADKDS